MHRQTQSLVTDSKANVKRVPCDHLVANSTNPLFMSRLFESSGFMNEFGESPHCEACNESLDKHYLLSFIRYLHTKFT